MKTETLGVTLTEGKMILFGSIKTINKGHARYLEARLIEMARTAGAGCA